VLSSEDAGVGDNGGSGGGVGGGGGGGGEATRSSDPEVDTISQGPDDCVIISRPTSPNRTEAGAQYIIEYDEDGIALMGCTGGLLIGNLPHLRSTCPVNPFTKSRGLRTVGCNPALCAKCYCYICDRPAVECPQWTSLDTTRPAHCNAHDKHSVWQRLRKKEAEARRLATHDS
jgi:hypothetical protein